MMARTGAQPKERKTPAVKGKSGNPARAAVARPTPKPAKGERLFRLPDGSRSVQSPWVWRGFAFMSLIAFGLFLSFVTGHHTMLAIAWGVITVGWFSLAMWLWRRHLRDDDEWYARQRGRRPA
jgi:hypothetical protein